MDLATDKCELSLCTEHGAAGLNINTARLRTSSKCPWKHRIWKYRTKNSYLDGFPYMNKLDNITKSKDVVSLGIQLQVILIITKAYKETVFYLSISFSSYSKSMKVFVSWWVIVQVSEVMTPIFLLAITVKFYFKSLCHKIKLWWKTLKYNNLGLPIIVLEWMIEWDAILGIL